MSKASESSEYLRGGQLVGHTGVITDLHWSHDGMILASASRDKTIRFWTTEHAALLRELTEHISSVTCLAWSPSDEWLISGSKDQDVCLWNRSGEKVGEFRHGDRIRSVAWSPNESLFAVAERNGTIHIWNRENRQRVHRWIAHERLNCLDWSNDGSLLLSSSPNGSVKVWDADSWQMKHETEFTEGVPSLTCSPCDPGLAVVASGCHACVMRIDRMEQELILERHTETINYVCYSSDGTRLATGAADGKLLVWECPTWKPIAELSTSKHRSALSAIAFHPSEPIVASVCRRGRAIQFWVGELPEEHPLARLRDEASSSASANGGPHSTLERIEEDRPKTDTDRQTVINIGNIERLNMRNQGDEIKVTRGNVINRSSNVRDNVLQTWNEQGGEIDLHSLIAELTQLRAGMKQEDSSGEHDKEIGKVHEAEEAASEGDDTKAMDCLSKAGQWTLSVANKLGLVVVTAALKKSLGL